MANATATAGVTTPDAAHHTGRRATQRHQSDAPSSGAPETDLSVARGAAAAVVGAGLHAAAAHAHRAPGGARVGRAVVERPAADIARARLQALPAPVEHRRDGGGEDAPERAV